MLPSNSFLRRSSSNSSTNSTHSLSNNRNYRQWTTLFNTILDLNEKNYTKNSRNVTTKLQNIIQTDVLNESRSSTTAILYILYERSIQELLLKTFPVSASLIENLTSASTEDIFNAVQPVIQEHLQRLQIKLRNTSSINGADVGVACLLINMYRLDKMAGRSSPISKILEQIVNDTSDYIELIPLDKHFANDSFVILLFCLIWYALSLDCKLDVDILKAAIRKGHVKYHRNISVFGRVMALDIIEHMQNFDTNIKLYITKYKKTIRSQSFLLSGIEDYIGGTPYPAEQNHENVDSVNESVTLFHTQTSIEHDEVFSNDPPSQQSKSNTKAPNNRLDPEGSSGSEEDGKECKKKSEFEIKSQILSSKTSSGSSSSSLDDSQTKWERKISQEAKVDNSVHEDDGLVETIRIPERYVGRVIGLEGAIARKIELRSKVSLVIGKKEDPERPDTTCLTAHRLITGALGVRSQMPHEQIQEEKQKLKQAKVKRNTEKQEIVTREVEIRGSNNQIESAKKLINEIINDIVTLSVPLKLNVEDLLQNHGNKIKTIENLLNVYIEIEEQSDLTIILDISGDRKSCSDARKLIFEDLCQFKTESGQMFTLPMEIQSILQTDIDLLLLFGTVKDICGVNINKVITPNGPSIFVSGMFSNVSKAINIFQVATFELTLALAQEGNEVNCEQLCEFIQEKFGRRREIRRSLSKSPTLLKENLKDLITISSDAEDDIERSQQKEKKKRITYNRNHLLDVACSMKVDVFPDLLREFSIKDEDASQVVMQQLNDERLSTIIQQLSIV